MKKHMTRLWRDFRFPLIAAFGTLPVPLILTAYYAPALLPMVWAWPLAYVLLDALSTKVRGKWRIAYAACELLLAVAAGWLLSKVCIDMLALFIPVMYGVLLLWGLILAAGDRNETISPLWYVIGVIIHILGQLFLYSSKVLENPALKPVEPWLLISFFLFAALGLISMNQANLSFATSGRQRASRIMQRKNLLLVLAFFGIALLICSVPAIVNAVSEFFRWLILGILWLLSKLDREQEVETIGTAPTVETGVIDTGGSSGMPDWLSMILMVIALILVAAVLVYALYWFGKKLVIFAKYLMRVMGEYLHAVSEDYVDEITDTRDDDDQNLRRTKKRRVSAAEERKLPPDQRIRYRYLRLMLKHPEWDSGSTARENLSPEAAPIYEKVRYSPHPVTEEDAQQFAADTKRM